MKIKTHQEFIDAIHEVEEKYGTVTNPEAKKDKLLIAIRKYANKLPGKNETDERSKYVYTITFKNGKVVKATTIKNLVNEIKKRNYSISASWIRHKISMNNKYFKFGTIERELGE